MGSWSVTRRIGVGDRELVRAGLFQVCIVDPEQTETQLLACLRAASSMNRALRVYINCDRLSAEFVHYLIFNTMSQFRNHDFMEEIDISRDHFNWVLGRSDLIVERNDEGEEADLSEELVRVWKESNERHFLNLGAWYLTDTEARAKFPSMYKDDDRLWERWSRK